MTTIEKLDKAHKAFIQVQSKLAKWGASDTEPDTVYHWEVRNAIQGLPFEPLTASQWQLYTCSMKCGGAAKRLNAALTKVVNVIACSPLKDRQEVLAWARTNIWRVDVDNVQG